MNHLAANENGFPSGSEVKNPPATSLLLFTFMHWRKKWQPTPVFLPGESQGQRSLVGGRHGVTQSRTRLKRLPAAAAAAVNAGRPKRRRCDPWVGKTPGEGNGNPLQYSCLGNSMDRGAWWATVHRFAEGLDMTEHDMHASYK